MSSSPEASPPVWVGMSGGVDSSLAASLLTESGRTCIGVTMDLGRGALDISAARAAADVCSHLGIEHRTIDVASAFRSSVIEASARAYADGLTPNPCVACNVEIKFGALFRAALSAGADLATGHYARIVGPEGARRLATASDCAKDQSYFLYRVRPDVLERVAFPLGEFTKTEVRQQAAERGLRSLHTAESQDACFLGPGGYPEIIARLHPEACEAGPLLAEDGTVVGTHAGICRYTIGQRKGLGIASPEPLYVLAIDVAANALVVGPHRALERHVLCVGDAVWWSSEDSVDCRVRVRYNSPAVPSRVTWSDAGLRIELQESIFGAAPGQSAVCYQDDIVIGGGIIREAL